MYPWRFPQRFPIICGSRSVLTRPRQYRSEMTQNVVFMALELGLQFWSIQDELIVTLPKSDPIKLTYDWRTSAVVKVGASTQVHPRLTIQMGSYLDGIPAAVPTDTSGESRQYTNWRDHWSPLDPHSSFGLSAHYEGIHWLARDATGYDTPQNTADKPTCLGCPPLF